MDYKKVIKQLTGPNSTQDLMNFLETLPAKVGTLVLAAGGIAWAVAGIAILYGTMQSGRIAQLKTDLAEIESLTPPVPVIQNIAVDKANIENFVAKANTEYERTGITISEERGKIQIVGNTGRQYGVFREAVGHIQNGGEGWRVSVEELCVGRECANRDKGVRAFLFGNFAVSKVNVDMPG